MREGQFIVHLYSTGIFLSHRRTQRFFSVTLVDTFSTALPVLTGIFFATFAHTSTTRLTVRAGLGYDRGRSKGEAKSVKAIGLGPAP